jgi:hypothetical protein
MGVIPVLEEKFAIEGCEWEVSASTTTGDLSVPEDGTMQISLRVVKGEDWTHGVFVPLVGSDDRFLNRFMDAFRTSSEFRARCEIVGEDSEINRETGSGERLPSLPASPAPSRDAGVARLVRLGKKAKFKDFASLRSGRDGFSNKKEDQLIELLGPDAARVDTLISSHADDIEASERLKVMRWVARGLPADMALRKVMTDMEVSKNSKRSRR